MRVSCLGSYQLLFRAHPSSRYSIAALVGAIENDGRLGELQVKAPVSISPNAIREALNQGQTIIAQSVMSTQLERVKKECDDIRQAFHEEVIMIAGGPHASVKPGQLLDFGFDYVVIGEGERTLPDLLWHLINNLDPSVVEGVVSKKSSNYVVPRNLAKVNLDDYPPFALQRNILGPVEVTRGCPYRCKFCSTPFLTGGSIRHRSVKSVAYWLRRAVEERGFKRTWFLSPNALSYGGRGRDTEIEKLEQLLQQATSIDGLEEVFFGSFPSEVRPEFVTKGALDMMRSYVANETIQIGMQSASNRVLKLANRHHSVEEAMTAIRTAFDCDFIPHVDMIFGLPGESKVELDTSIEMCESLAKMGARVHGHVFMPLPGSEFEYMPPGRLDSDSRSVLGDLSRRGMLTGSWSTQEKLAQRLSMGKLSGSD
ncbi:MAG: TIGR04013 family B12-binding domain/radical SAM domain-containing protein [Candidatus Thorarchaeota archaeon]|nr:TIGR04013 family B12-binding domain/radical SAM domain-containing protein [Candidatus Thorarchaeota archaeon]